MYRAALIIIVLSLILIAIQKFQSPPKLDADGCYETTEMRLGGMVGGNPIYLFDPVKICPKRN